MNRKKKPRIGRKYADLKTILFWNIIVFVLLAFFSVIALYDLVFSNRIAEFMVGMIRTLVFYGHSDSYERALDLYNRVFRNYAVFYMLLGMLVIFAVIVRFYLNRFTRYFSEIEEGLDMLVREETGRISFSAELSPMENKLNDIRYLLERRKLDAQAAEQRKNDLIVYLAHDLKTPLTSVIGYLTLLYEEPELPQEQRCRYTGVALEKAERLEELINEFFDITRFNMTSIVLNLEQVNLSRMLEQVVSEFHPILAERELRWDTQIEGNVEILCDADKLERVFDNLIRNAVAYSYKQTAIALTMRQQEDFVEIQVKNHGNTIPEEKLAHIFEQFFRLDASRSASTGGAGLGLAIAKEIVELHGGTITAVSAAESIVFTVSIPRDCKRGG
ncbi:MAG: HAMP domain-containing histidine kinase [Roseburia sp.]|nr:HAMP domain-containing histidine kinase [Roseburia sp.]